MIGKYIFIVFFILIAVPSRILAETTIHDPAIAKISDDIYINNFRAAIESSQNIIDREPGNPLGYFLLGAIYQTVSEEYRNDSFKDDIDSNLEMAIDLCDKRLDKDPDNAGYYFISGAAYGYLGLHRAFHGNWWTAFRDGLKCNSNLKIALELDSTFYDAYWGLGAYYYYRTLKAKDFIWLPFITDDREKGMSMIRRAIDSGFLANELARPSFLRIYTFENRYDEVITLADSLLESDPDDPYYLLYYIEALLALGKTDEAEEAILDLKVAWKESSYFDPDGALESELLYARLALARGDGDTFKKIIDYLISQKSRADENAYFAETYKKVKEIKDRNR
nr:tetratricopeptide repeat protein [candidate division Zixibacteria bacterium]